MISSGSALSQLGTLFTKSDYACCATASNKGHDFRLLQDFMGHRDPRHTSGYTRTASRRFEGLGK